MTKNILKFVIHLQYSMMFKFAAYRMTLIVSDLIFCKTWRHCLKWIFHVQIIVSSSSETTRIQFASWDPCEGGLSCPWNQRHPHGILQRLVQLCHVTDRGQHRNLQASLKNKISTLSENFSLRNLSFSLLCFLFFVSRLCIYHPCAVFFITVTPGPRREQ